MSRGQKVGQGNTADIYAWGEGEIVKVFHERVPDQWVQDELAVSLNVMALGLAVPRCGGEVTVDGRRALVFARVEGPSMTQVMGEGPDALVRGAERLAMLHRDIHAQSGDGFAGSKEKLTRAAAEQALLSERQREQVVAYVAELPEGDRLLHGDLHPENVLVGAEGPVVLDWTTAMCGHPAFDVARTAWILRHGALPDHLPTAGLQLLMSRREELEGVYVTTYLDVSGLTAAELEAWMLPMLVVRLGEAIPEAEQRLVLERIVALLA